MDVKTHDQINMLTMFETMETNHIHAHMYKSLNIHKNCPSDSEQFKIIQT